MARLNADLTINQTASVSKSTIEPMKNYQVGDIKSLIDSAKTALVVVPQISVDGIAAALGLAIALKKKNIETRVFCPQKTDNNYSKLSGLELLTESLSSGDLMVSLSYPLDQIENVSYNDDGGKLNLIVKTKSGSPKIESNQIEIKNESSLADVAFILGEETALGVNSGIVNNGNWVYISPANNPKTWAKASLVDPDAPFSEIFSFLLPMLGLELDVDSGKNLLIGMRVATQSFSVNVSPESFEAGAICLRATQPAEEAPVSPSQPTPIENIEKSGNLTPGTNKPNPTPRI